MTEKNESVLRLPAEQIELLESFRDVVCKRAHDVDPDEEFQWYDLSVGFFIAKGATPEVAWELATHARYTFQYWHGCKLDNPPKV